MCKSLGSNEMLPSWCSSKCGTLYDKNDAEHRQRSASSYISVNGSQRICVFDVILPKVGYLSVLCLTWISLIQYVQNTQTSETKEFRKKYSHPTFSLSNLSRVMVSLDCYRGELTNPWWRDIDAGMTLFPLLAIFWYNFSLVGMYSTLCIIEVDLSKLSSSLVPHQREDGKVYYEARYEVALLFGLTEFKAQLCWQDNGVLKRWLFLYASCWELV